MTKIIVSADDIGMTPGVTDGILRCVDDDLLTNVSIIANGWDFDRAAAELRKRPRVRVTVHANLVEGSPISPPESVPRLIGRDGRFQTSFVSFLLRNITSTPRIRRDLAAQVEREVRAQIERVRDALGEDRPLHLDSHQHVHMVPFIFEIFLRLATDLNLHYLRLVNEPLFFHGGHGAMGVYFGSGIVKHLLLKALAHYVRPQLRASGISYCGHFVGVLFTGRMTAKAADAALKALVRRGKTNETIEVLFHPGRAADGERVLWRGHAGFERFYCSPNRDIEALELRRLRLPREFEKIN